MARRRRLKVNIGKQYVRGDGRWPSEAGYIAMMASAAKSITDQLLSVLDQFEDATEDIMIAALEPTFEKAISYTPVDTTALVKSAYLEKNSFRGKPSVEMGFARGGVPNYAMYVHEITSYKHFNPSGARAKFLQTAVQEDIDAIFQRLGQEYRAFMGSGA